AGCESKRVRGSRGRVSDATRSHGCGVQGDLMSRRDRRGLSGCVLSMTETLARDAFVIQSQKACPEGGEAARRKPNARRSSPPGHVALRNALTKTRRPQRGRTAYRVVLNMRDARPVAQ